MKTPVALVLFNRPQLVARVFERVAEAKPETLFLIADGPRHQEDLGPCEAAREIVNSVTWPTEVYINFSQINLGCGRRISSGLDWVFARAPEAIILEDDCLPSPDFFPFCEELLSRYRNNLEVGIISGNNFVSSKLECADSYYFSRYSHIWGWATWRRTWKLFDFNLSKWPKFRDGSRLKSISRRPETASYWEAEFDDQFRFHTRWASRLIFTCFYNNLLNIIPGQNLVSNIGWGESATTSKNANSPLANIPTGRIQFPLRHPGRIVPFRDADEATEIEQFTRR